MRFIVKSTFRALPSLCKSATMYAYVVVQNLRPTDKLD